MNDAFELILLRHAHAEPASAGYRDIERVLSPRGVEEAQAAAAWLAGRPAPTRVVSSPAGRARQTAEAVGAQFAELPIAIEPRIYDAQLRDLFDVIEAHRDAERLLLVGHNPGFESLVALLVTGQSSDHRGMPPAGIAWLVFPDRGSIEPGSARLDAFWSP